MRAGHGRPMLHVIRGIHFVRENVTKMRLFSSLLLQADSFWALPARPTPRASSAAPTSRALNCARCHSIERSGPSPYSEAPPFRTLHHRYPVENLEEALGEGIFTGHPAMPEFELSPGQIGDFIAFLKSLE